MSSRTYTKRNRPVTACRECHRRKQKCDRLKPCNICLMRNVPEKCLYGDDMAKLIRASKRDQAEPLTPPSDPETTPEYSGEPSTKGLEEQIGYSAFSDNAFIDLYKSIDAVHISSTNALGLSTTPLRPNLKEKYFRIASSLPSITICELLIDIYFIEADWYFMALDRYYFERLYTAWKASALPNESTIQLEQYPRDLQHFPALLFQVLAVGLQFSPAGSEVYRLLNITDRTLVDKQSQSYSESGSDIMGIMEGYGASITAVEHDIMKMSWLKNCSRGSESWHCIGHAIRQAQDLELHLDSEVTPLIEGGHATLEQVWYDEYRRRVWARVFLLDSHMAFVLGRPRHIHLDDCTAEWPTDCDIPADLTHNYPSLPSPHEIPSSFTFVTFLQQIGLKIHEFMSARSKKAFLKDPSKIDKLHRDVETILETLPPAMRPQNPDRSWDQQRPHFPKVRQQILSTANSFLMKLHRPYINVNEASRNSVIRAALGTLDAQQGLFESMADSPNQHRIYGFSFYTIDAAMLLSAVAINRCPSNPDLVSHIDQSLREAIGRLSVLKKTSLVAASGEQLLIQCYAKINAQYPFLPSEAVREDGSYPSSTSEFADMSQYADTWEEYALPDPQDFELGAMVQLFDSSQHFRNVDDKQDQRLDGFTAADQGIHLVSSSALT